MIQKNDFIKDLAHKKIVLGNGFDLHCKLKTKYSDFFTNFWNRKGNISNLIDAFLEQPSKQGDLSKELNDINVWDLYFYLLSKPSLEADLENWNWCDVESKIEESLSKTKSTSSLSNNYLTWDNIFLKSKNLENHIPVFKNGIYIEPTKQEQDSLFLLANYCSKFKAKDANDYSWLLGELKKFEKCFGQYLKEQLKESGNDYSNNAKTFFKLFDDNRHDSIANIDTFNFTNFNNCYSDKLHHINGDIDHPIFGIDSTSGLDNDTILFSKTSRRMELDMISDTYNKNLPFYNIVIYGHSLCQADYSYFFSIFDMVKIYNTEEISNIVFAYSIPGENEEEKMNKRFMTRKNTILSINNLFKEYAMYKGYKEQPYRMLDYLTTQRRVVLYEI